MKREAAKKKEAEGEGVTRSDCHCRSVVSSINPSIHPSINHISSDTKPFVYSCMQHDPEPAVRNSSVQVIWSAVPARQAQVNCVTSTLTLGMCEQVGLGATWCNGISV